MWMLKTQATQRRWLWLVLAVILAAGTLSIWSVATAKRQESRRVPLATIRGAIETLETLHRKKVPGDWMTGHPQEKGQTFEQYRRQRPKRLTEKYRHLGVQPLGKCTPTQRELVLLTEDYLSRLFGLPVQELETLEADVVPNDARRVHPTTGDRQIRTSYVLKDLLPPRRDNDTLALLALTAEDLYPAENWNFVFGEASLSEGVGVWSIYRFGDPDESYAARQTCLLRMLKVAGHETGHMLSIPHCTALECGMNGANSLSETDSQPLSFCPHCAAKIWWALDLEPATWYESLAAFAREQGLHKEAQVWEQRLDAL